MKVCKFKKLGLDFFAVRHFNSVAGHLIVGKLTKRFEFEIPKFRPKAWLRHKKVWLIDTITQRKIYGWYSSTDCDHYHVEYAMEFKNRKAWIQFSECDIYDDVEGPTWVERITKEEYLELKNDRVERDYVMEAHEDGHPYSVEG